MAACRVWQEVPKIVRPVAQMFLGLQRSHDNRRRYLVHVIVLRDPISCYSMYAKVRVHDVHNTPSKRRGSRVEDVNPCEPEVLLSLHCLRKLLHHIPTQGVPRAISSVLRILLADLSVFLCNLGRSRRALSYEYLQVIRQVARCGPWIDSLSEVRATGSNIQLFLSVVCTDGQVQSRMDNLEPPQDVLLLRKLRTDLVEPALYAFPTRITV
mmetsp:Transcript_38541/g.86670  ORF Transcript_38541/g.86670 Transcript_38541/m.86670 type:complete len:211 (+) Transcript_38541:539-1171(+)